MKEYKNSKLCQTCAKCCKVWWLYTDDKADAIRASLLQTDLIFVKKVNEKLWQIIFNIPCNELAMDEGKYVCKRYKGVRPEYCRTYPNNFLDEKLKVVIDWHKEFCPAFKKLKSPLIGVKRNNANIHRNII